MTHAASKPVAHATDAPIFVDRVALRVRDLDRVGDFYQRAIGLDRVSGDGETLRLGRGGKVLLELRSDPAARSYPAAAGLFHTAFLLPTRAELGGWLRHAAQLNLRIEGAADHLVSEAVYLSDPEGNGIEIYADRPREMWERDGATVRMANARLDIPGLMQIASEWRGAPEGTVIGHVHLQVGQIPEAERFYAGTLGLDLSSRMPSASFYASGGYHHHIATNTWNSRDSGPRSADSAGLAELVLSVTPERAAVLGQSEFDDPWNNRIRIEERR
ncbi:VOC family protein [Paracoccus aurantiacus]|uniref:VOC family protein n=1 Tax=Paracoccus aurantiacus TaxID=2599412 RepID=A0A5C6SC91_9RHOB|nr:VOC family protein [Paracoccus aurantiacus]TXB71215.1 VOC family protein [Paracoccus aurantiacus]